ncbi:MAG TPA: 50S ribosomal protein L30 [Turneriella sp.]|nr:50S ribosomal protein L30 [Turneriella sp.]HNA79071.1 50S ribosomal protein L30 [Turneriella sp.]HNE19989.1 50S ribosomal protein L30 [Turneriella sp.]HNJ64364.1 50S ribosomal protein L30 [Turneriella sp.]HNL52847.1 50S ribosomal protein L30 [Turneriella sp.]
MKKVRVTQTRSATRKSDKQQATLVALGLRRIGMSREHVVTPQLEGMLKKVGFLVKVEAL